MESEWDLNGILMGYDISPQKNDYQHFFSGHKKASQDVNLQSAWYHFNG